MTVQIGQAIALVGGTLDIALPEKCLYWFIQNQSLSPLKVSFLGTDWGHMTDLILCPAARAGYPGGKLDSLGFPYFSTLGFRLTSADATAPFGSGASPNPPVNFYPYPGFGPQNFGG